MKKEVNIVLGVLSVSVVAVGGIGLAVYYNTQGSERGLSNSKMTGSTPMPSPQGQNSPANNANPLELDRNQVQTMQSSGNSEIGRDEKPALIENSIKPVIKRFNNQNLERETVR